MSARTHSVHEVIAGDLRYWVCDHPGCRHHWAIEFDQQAIESEPCTPDLEFPYPPCSLCDNDLTLEDTTWYCEKCEVTWELNGSHGEYTGENEDDGE